MAMNAAPTDRHRPEFDFASLGSSTPTAVDGRLISDLVATRAFQRLRSVRFLGGIDYLLVPFPNGHRGNARYTRYQHSLGVARLALIYCNLRGLNACDRRLVVAAGLLHDIGHGPLSHSLEPLFKEVFGLEHHRVTTDIISGRTNLGREVYEVLRQNQIDTERVIAIIAAEDLSFDEFFGGPINFDTIEGILRTHSYSGNTTTLPNPETVLRAATLRISVTDRDIVDAFWLYKDSAYRYFIQSPKGVLADFACQSFMRRNLSRLSAKDYLSTEDQLFRKLPGLRKVLTSASFEADILRLTDEPVVYTARRFFVEPMVDFFARRDQDRYRQTRERRILAPRSAGIPEQLPGDLSDDSGDRSRKGSL